MDCLDSVIKYILYFFNLLFLICGVLLIILGSIMLSDMGDLKSFSEAVHSETIPIMIIVLGCVIFIISFCGCCGAIKENIFCSATYGIFMFILFCLQVALVVWIFVKRDDFLNSMGDIVKSAWKENTEANKYPMDTLEISFSCCGIVNYTNYTDPGLPVPNSCCGLVSTSDVSACPLSAYQNKPGCLQTFVNFWSSNMNIIRYAGIGVAIVELVALTFSCCLTNGIRKSRQMN